MSKERKKWRFWYKQRYIEKLKPVIWDEGRQLGMLVDALRTTNGKGTNTIEIIMDSSVGMLRILCYNRLYCSRRKLIRRRNSD